MRTYLCIVMCYASLIAMSQSQVDSANAKLQSVQDISDKTISGLEKQYSGLTDKLNAQSAKLLSKMQSKESRLQQKVQNTDSAKSAAVFTDEVKNKYQSLKSTLSDTSGLLRQFPLKEYVPGLDSMQTSLTFLLRNKNLPTDKLQQIQELSTKLKGLEAELQKANDIQSFVRDREAQLKEQLLNMGFARQLTGINKQVFYYQAQLSEYKSILNDKEKLKEKLLQTVSSLPVFQKFWQKYSYLNMLFPMPVDPDAPTALAGLQTRTSIQSVLAQRVNSAAAGGMSPQQYFQQQLGNAQNQLTQLKNKLSGLNGGGGSSDMTMPDFKPNEQKTKSFLERLEYGFNIQSEHGRYYLPTTSDFALTLGYKFSDSKRAGIGVSYKLGWGNGFRHISLSSQGIGLRSYIDIKSPVKSKGIFFGGLWISGGFELNYFNSFRSLQDLHENIDVWQKSALLGLSKKYKIGKKEGNMQILYDFLHNYETPPSQAIKFRLGYTF